jgi:hypothetical protein
MTIVGELFSHKPPVLMLLLLPALLWAPGGVPAQTCGDLDHSGAIDFTDEAILFNYLYDNGPAPDPLWIADIDGVPGITNNDFHTFNEMWFSETDLRCDVTPDTTFPQSADTVEIRRTTVPAGYGEWFVDISLKAVDAYLDIALPFSFDCSTSPITLDSSRYANLIDSVNRWGVVTHGTLTLPENPAGEETIARLYFSLTPADFEQEILIDTTFVPPSHTTVLSRAGGPYLARGYVPVLVTTGSCCRGFTGNVDCDPDDVVDVSDIQALIDNLFLSLSPLCCEAEANINYPGSGYPETDDEVDITDLSLLVDNQFLTLSPLSTCP